jgi:polyphenol oxidase
MQNYNQKLVIGVSTVKDGNMSLKWGKKEEVTSNKEKFLKKYGLKPDETIAMFLVSGDKILEVGAGDVGKRVHCDGLITKDAGVGLWMAVGDCFPVVVFDPIKQILAMVHAGRLGVGKHIVTKVIKELIAKGSRACDLEVWIGPGIRKESYRWWEIKKVTERDDPDWQPFLETKVGIMHIDVVGYINKQLGDEGVEEKNIQDCGIDTVTDKNYFSHYRSAIQHESEGRFGVVAMIQK